MKKIFIITLSLVMLAFPFAASFAEGSTFTDDLGRLRLELEEAQPIVTGYSFTYNDIARVTSYCVENVLQGWQGSSPSYFAVPIFSRYNDTGEVISFSVYVFIADTDGFSVTLKFPDETTATTLMMINSPTDAHLYQYNLSRYYLTGDLKPDSATMHLLYGTTLFNTFSKFPLIAGEYNEDGTDFKARYRCIDSIDYLTLQSVNNAHVQYIPYGSTEPDPEVSDFFSVPSLSVIISTGERYLWHHFKKTAMVQIVCGVGLAASLIALNLFGKVLRKFRVR